MASTLEPVKVVASSPPPPPSPPSRGTRLRPLMWAGAVVVAAIVGGALLWSLAAPPPIEDLNARSTMIMVHNQSFHAANVSLTHCTGAPGSATPYQSFTLPGVTFTMHIESCFSPGGLLLKGEATRPGGPAWPFSESDRVLPGDDGHTTSISSDQEVGVRDFGYSPTVLVHA